MVKRSQRGVNKGAWTAEEDKKLVSYVLAHGDNNWRTLPTKAGLNRCGKSCRMRWLNYLRPGIKRGNISEEEEDLIIRLHNLLGNRWSLIAGRIPGRTDNEIKNHWNTHLSKRSLTISDLNNKLKSTGSLSNSTDHDIGFATDSEFDVEELLNFAPTLSRQDDGSRSSTSELGVEDYGINAGVDGHREPLNSESCNNTFGYLNSELRSHSSEFDDLEQFLGCQDLGLCFTDC